MNDVQIKLLEIAKEYINICNKHNLTYFALAGTCLGAIRHNGFIPWDDDIDFCMPRDDYEKFLSVCATELPDRLFIQTHQTDKEYFLKYAKLRDSNTTCIEKATKHLHINHGIWIDIFPLDGLPKTKLGRKILNFRENKLLKRVYLSYRFDYKSFANSLLNIIAKLLYRNKENAYRKSERISMKYTFGKTKYVWWNDSVKSGIETTFFQTYIDCRFESIIMRVPRNFDEYLTAHYGNWKQIPNQEDRVSVHNIECLDLSKSYLCYISTETVN